MLRGRLTTAAVVVVVVIVMLYVITLFTDWPVKRFLFCLLWELRGCKSSQGAMYGHGDRWPKDPCGFLHYPACPYAHPWDLHGETHVVSNRFSLEQYRTVSQTSRAWVSNCQIPSKTWSGAASCNSLSDMGVRSRRMVDKFTETDPLPIKGRELLKLYRRQRTQDTVA